MRVLPEKHRIYHFPGARHRSQTPRSSRQRFIRETKAIAIYPHAGVYRLVDGDEELLHGCCAASRCCASLM